ncbi:hypothetical protein CI089_04495 [Microbacterium sp. Yaish 1]|nr:hypothetical protein CI089_04495 [Microbacterium sp. Yaish 1]
MVRVIGIVAVVAGHISTEGVIRPLLYSWHVPLFFVLVGYFWSAERTLRAETVSRLRSLVVPTLVWGTGIYLAYSAINLLAGSFDGAVPVSAYMAYWFTPALLMAALVCRLLSPLPAWVSWAVASVGVGAAYVANDIVASAPLYVGAALPGLFFVMIGRAARRYRGRLRLRFVLPVFATVVSLIALGVSAPVDMKNGDLGTPILSVLAAAVISLTLIVVSETYAPRLPRVVSTVATHLALSGWAVILGHAAFILAFRHLGAPPAFVFLSALVLPWVIGLVALPTRASPAVNGSPKQVGLGSGSSTSPRSSTKRPVASNGASHATRPCED